MNAILRTLDQDFRHQLSIWNLKKVAQMTYDQIHALQLEQGVAHQTGIPIDQDELISANEVSLMIFLANSGDQIFKEYFKEIVNVPNRDVVDDYIEILYNFIFCFIDTTATAGCQDGGPSLYKTIKKANSIRDVQPKLASSENLSIIWLT